MGLIERWALCNILDKQGQRMDKTTIRCCPQHVLPGTLGAHN